MSHPQPIHNYGPGCSLAKAKAKADAQAKGKPQDDIPVLKAQYFYTSPHSIDNPLSPVPAPGVSDAKSNIPRPFMPADNDNLEVAWLAMGSDKDRKQHLKVQVGASVATKGEKKKEDEDDSQKDKTPKKGAKGDNVETEEGDAKGKGAEGTKKGSTSSSAKMFPIPGLSKPPTTPTPEKKDPSSTSNKKTPIPSTDSTDSSSDKDKKSPTPAPNGKLSCGCGHESDQDGPSQEPSKDTPKEEGKKSGSPLDHVEKSAKDEFKKLDDRGEKDLKDGKKSVEEKVKKFEKSKSPEKAKKCLQDEGKKLKDDVKKAIKDGKSNKPSKEDNKKIREYHDQIKKSPKDDFKKVDESEKPKNPSNPESKKSDSPEKIKYSLKDEGKKAEGEDKSKQSPKSGKASSKSSRSPSPTKAHHSKTLDDGKVGRDASPSKKGSGKKIKHTKSSRDLKDLKKGEDSSPSRGRSPTKNPEEEDDHPSENPSNTIGEDPHHTEASSNLPSCCEDLERSSKPRAEEHSVAPEGGKTPDVESHALDAEAAELKGEKAKSKGKSSRRTKLSGAQGDAAHDSNASEEDEPEHKVFVKHMKSKSHQEFDQHKKDKTHKDFEDHLKAKHPQGYSLDDNESDVQGKKKDSSWPDKLSKNSKDNAPDLQAAKEKSRRGPSQARDQSNSENIGPSEQHRPVGNEDAGTTGLLFLKLSSRASRKTGSEARSRQSHQDGNEGKQNRVQESSENDKHNQDELEVLQVHPCKAHKNTKAHFDITVGASRLHQVEIPALLMKPVYWSPLADITPVTRGTWFYKNTMLPVEPAVANQLETGYREVRAWSQTWSDQLSSALEVGAAGEEKVAHQLWPKDDKKSKQQKKDDFLSTDPYCAARCFRGEAAAEGSIDIIVPDEKDPLKPMAKTYGNAQVLYKDAHDAFILKPTLQPSAYHGRKPLAKINKGFTIGVPVVRGFDWSAWEKLHPVKKCKASKVIDKTNTGVPSPPLDPKKECPACKAKEGRPQVTDLVLVIHGIGQKLSERVESFHFTHAINSFRREVNVELLNPDTQRLLREDMGEVMVLPVNWRHNLSFEDGGPKKEGDKSDKTQDFTLKDITLDTIPAVRNLISDVMLDIPYYMSHHKPMMVQAVINEANRVYRLWCTNNPDFPKKGRVHIIAHSLGSAMALEVLSKQPTYVPLLDIKSAKPNTKCLDFRTTNLFLAGSPAGFYLLLENGKLIPRYGMGKPGADFGDDHDKESIVGNEGTFGCLAVDNVYNIMHYNDPIAYRLNATVDPQYAASLRPAQVPSASTSIFDPFLSTLRAITPGVANSSDASASKPPAVQRLPSQLEMEIHDFSREEIAEKKFYLLNDNGQVDWFLSSGGGPLEVSYINMLGAHSSYWVSPDFVRMIVQEVGRKPGKECALPSMSAVKAGFKAGVKA